jgi:hypothetical protein
MNNNDEKVIILESDTFVSKIMQNDLLTFLNDQDLENFTRPYIHGEFTKEYPNALDGVTHVLVIKLNNNFHLRIPLTENDLQRYRDATLTEEEFDELLEKGIKDEFIDEQEKQTPIYDKIEIKITQVIESTALNDRREFEEHPEARGFSREYVDGEFGDAPYDKNLTFTHVLVFKEDDRNCRIPLTLAEFTLFSNNVMNQEEFNKIALSRTFQDVFTEEEKNNDN